MSTIDAYSPAEIAERVEHQGVTKATLPLFPTAMLGILGGGFIAIGAMFQMVIISDPGWLAGPARFIGGIVFAGGYLVAFSAGAQVFTSNNLVIMSWAVGKISTPTLVRNWSLVFIFNAVGAVGMAGVLLMAGHPELYEGRVRDSAIEVGLAKAQEEFWTAFFRGVMGNLLVCIAVWVAMGGRSITDKFIGPLLPLAAVSICGFEHCVGNLYYLAMAILIKVTHTVPETSLSLGVWMVDSLRNLIAVTLGNILGGSGLVALVYHAVYRRGLDR